MRISGPGTASIASAMLGHLPQPRYAEYLPFYATPDSTSYHGENHVIDRGIALYFPEPHSFTGEDVLELQGHGGPVVMDMLIKQVITLGARLARPGEFSERAFLNDKLDLVQAEAVSDLIDASTEAAARSATRSLSGGFSAEIRALDQQLMRLRMLVEATLDFPEEDIDFLQQADADGQLAALSERLRRIEDTTRQGALLRDGITVVIAGQPNVGKSSLLNALAGAELAIVTPIAGTTRDKVSQTIQIEGVPVHVIDTAGLREPADTNDAIERIGIERSWREIEAADALLFLHDLTRQSDADHAAGDAAIRQRLPRSLIEAQRVLDVHNKADLRPDLLAGWPSGLCLSATTGTGLDLLRQRMLQMAGWHEHPEGVYTARARHLSALAQTRLHVDAAAAQWHSHSPPLDLLAEELRLAQRALGEIVGQSTPDDLLGEIFSRFCIGK